MVKKIEDKVKELVEGKKQNIELHRLNEDFVIDNICVHEDIAGYSVNGDWVAVMTKDSTTHVYPAKQIAYIKHYTV
jgi:hypothetical protein